MVLFNFASTIRFLPFSRSIDYKIKPNHRKSMPWICVYLRSFVGSLVRLLNVGWMLEVGSCKKKRMFVDTKVVLERENKNNKQMQPHPCTLYIYHWYSHCYIGIHKKIKSLVVMKLLWHTQCLPSFIRMNMRTLPHKPMKKRWKK